MPECIEQLWNSNLGFALFLGLLYGSNQFVNSLAFSKSFQPDGFDLMANLGFAEALPLWLKAMLFSPFAALINIVMLAACVRLSWEGPAAWPWRLFGGLVHGVVHAFAVLGIYWAMSHLLVCLGCEPGTLRFGVLTWALVTAVGVVVGGLIFGLAFAVSSFFGHIPYNGFSSLAIEDYKGFLRFALTEDGVRARFLAVDKVRRDWSPGTHGPDWKVVDEFDLK